MKKLCFNSQTYLFLVTHYFMAWAGFKWIMQPRSGRGDEEERLILVYTANSGHP